MIDTPMYHRMSASAINNPHVRVTGDEAVTQVSLDICPEDTLLLMLPATVYGYDLYDHRWSELLVSNISDVAWNARIFDQLTMSNNDRNLVQAMATWPKANDTTWTSTRNSGGRHVLLLHGAPGSGKTYTAKAIAEITRRPLYRISCSDVGTNVSTAEDYMRSVSEICNAWDCVVLFDDAEIFFEQRTMHDMERNAMVVTFLRCLDFFTGLVILTTNRVGTFDETVRSRVQLVIYLEQWNYDERVKIWKTVIRDLVSFIDQNQIDKLMSDIYLFAEWKLNGWEVDNMVKMAMQLACSQDECLSRRHFQQVFKNSEEFIAYISEVNGTDMGTIARGRRER
jgi:SpoVK/Ycf46/Vps4 family AAA+-type ATPase